MKFSIIIPVYNVAPYVAQCLNSLCAQDFCSWEAICVDDGSTDDSLAILNNYAACNGRIRVVHKTNGGVSSARNAALDMAIGEWILFLDADDFLFKGTLSYLDSITNRILDVDIVTYSTVKFNDGESPSWTQDDGLVEREIDISDSISLPELMSYFGSKLYRRTIFSEVRFQQYARGEDLLYLVRCISLAKRIVITNRTCYAYRQRMSSAVHKPVTVQSLSERIVVTSKILEGILLSGRKIAFVVYKFHAMRVIDFFAKEVFKTRCMGNDVLYKEWICAVDLLCQMGALPFGYRFIIALERCLFNLMG